MKPAKLAIAAVVVTIYIICPAYRYYAIGSWVAFKILNDKPGRYRVVPKGSRAYQKVLKGA